MTDELEEIRKRRLQELAEQQRKQAIEEQELKNQIEQLESLVKTYLTKDALARFSNLKIAHQEKWIRVLAALGQMIQRHQITSHINDIQFKEILKRLEPEKKEFKITRK